MKIEILEKLSLIFGCIAIFFILIFGVLASFTTYARYKKRMDSYKTSEVVSPVSTEVNIKKQTDIIADL